MMRAQIFVFVLIALTPVAAQQSTPSRATVPASPLEQNPTRLIAAQQLAMAAYPELRTRGLQMQSEPASDDGVRVTFAFAERDADSVMGLSRIRPTALVLEAKFDPEQRITRAMMRGALARTNERRSVRSLPGDWSQALELAGASFPPSKGAALLKQIDRDVARSAIGRLTATEAAFQNGTVEDGLYWEVEATTATGESVRLRFEPYGGRLIEFVKGGGQ